MSTLDDAEHRRTPPQCPPESGCEVCYPYRTSPFCYAIEAQRSIAAKWQRGGPKDDACDADRERRTRDDWEE